MSEYKPKYIRSSFIKELFVMGDQKIRVSAEAKGKVYEFLDKKVEDGVKAIIAKLPTKSKGDQQGRIEKNYHSPRRFGISVVYLLLYRISYHFLTTFL
jgi:hypothetical protein